MVVEEECGTVEADGRLARARSALHGEQLGERGPDDLVLLGLDGGDDVEHLAGARPLELCQQRVAAPQPGRRHVVARAAEEVVGDRDDTPTIDHDLPPAGQAERFLGAGAVEGDGDRCAPIEHHRLGVRVLHVPSPDVPGRTLFLVDAPEEQRSRAVGQERDTAGKRRRVVEIRISGSDEIRQQLCRPFPHCAQVAHGAVEVVLFGLQLGVGVGNLGAHGSRTPPKSRANAPAQKSPDIPGILNEFRTNYNTSSW